MPYLIATYERMNFDTKPTMRQACDVLFHTDYDGEYTMSGDHINPYHLPEQVEADLALAASTQLGDTFKLPFPDMGWGGWSSVMLKKVVVIEDPLESIDINDPVADSPQIGELFDYNGTGYRLNAFYREHIRVSKPDSILDEILAELQAEEGVDPYHVGKRRIKLEQCFAHEAEYVSGSSVGGCLAAIKDITITGLVSWDKRTLARMRLDYNRGIQRERDSGEFPHLTEKWIKDDTGVDN